uniref:Zinc finger and BTB domain containing 48 n=1 Tax=Labrus bergylta TaxID=56723 RepID=A0A3Q3F6W2_9LABR
MSAADSSHAQRVLSSLNQQRAVGKFCDAVLNVGGGVVYLAHRNILSCFSELFHPQSNMPSAPSTELCLQECPNDGLELLLNFVYTGKLTLDAENLDKVQRAAVSLCVPEAVALCQQFKESSGDAAPVKRKRGRPRKSLQIDLNERDVGQVAEGAVEEEDDDDEDVGDFEELNEDTDEEYVPVAEPSSLASSTSTPRKRRATSKTEKKENGEEVEEDSKKDCVRCPVCDKSFKSKYYLKVHNRRHTGERPFGCLKCGKRYFRKENLLIHEVRDCTKVQHRMYIYIKYRIILKYSIVLLHFFQCSTCSEQFMYKKNLTTHMMKVHGHPKPNACPQCPKTFLTKSELRVHEAAKHRGEKPFVCEECGHRASSRNGLQMHIKAIHRNERPFVCTLCGHAFSQKNNLNMHLRIHSGERPYQSSLDKHNRTHTGERPFSCDVCEQRFTEKGALLRHKASKHEEGRPHCCQICGKTFKAKEQLRVHLRRHKGMRKFECVDCGYKFTRQAHLRRHIQIHKRTENYNPRQRKLRNVIVQDVDGSPSEDPSLMAEESDYNPETDDVQESSNPAADSRLSTENCSGGLVGISGTSNILTSRLPADTPTLGLLS